jgi:hypothetical protein
MTQQYAKFEDGALWWRGTKPDFFFMPRDSAEKLRRTFAANQYWWFQATADAFVAELDAAIAEYDAWEDSLAA